MTASSPGDLQVAPLLTSGVSDVAIEQDRQPPMPQPGGVPQQAGVVAERTEPSPTSPGLASEGPFLQAAPSTGTSSALAAPEELGYPGVEMDPYPTATSTGVKLPVQGVPPPHLLPQPLPRLPSQPGRRLGKKARRKHRRQARQPPSAPIDDGPRTPGDEKMPAVAPEVVQPGQAAQEVDDGQDRFPCNPGPEFSSPSGFRSFCKPQFLSVGCQKCGSSSLYEAMTSHPNIRYSGRKELLFWKSGDRAGNEAEDKEQCDTRDFNHYLHNFRDIPYDEEVRTRGAPAITGEFSATYFECVCCPRLFRTHLPQAKIIVQLRKPGDRAYSRYSELQSAAGKARVRHWSTGMLDFESSTWQSWWGLRLPQLEQCLERAGTSVEARTQCASHDNIFGWSLYDVFLENWLASGYNANDLLILYMDDFASSGIGQMRRVEQFLHLPAYDYSGITAWRYNVAGSGWKVEASSAVQEPTTEVPGQQALSRVYGRSVARLRELCKEHGWREPPESWDSV